MNTNKNSSNAQACGALVASEASPQPRYQQIKLALDVHAASIVMVRRVEGAKPQPPQTLSPPAFLDWAVKQVGLVREVVSCYEAGPTGFCLPRRLNTLDVRNCVVCPTRFPFPHPAFSVSAFQLFPVVAHRLPSSPLYAARVKNQISGNASVTVGFELIKRS